MPMRSSRQSKKRSERTSRSASSARCLGLPGVALIAERFGKGRILLCGDSCHLFSPTGGYGMNTGVDDARNLSWKLAACVQGWAPPELFTTYELERKPIAHRNTQAALVSDAADEQRARTRKSGRSDRPRARCHDSPSERYWRDCEHSLPLSAWSWVRDTTVRPSSPMGRLHLRIAGRSTTRARCPEGGCHTCGCLRPIRPQ